MNILVRDLDPVAIKKIDELAARKKVSRSEYLRQMINSAAILDAVSDTGDKYERLVHSVLNIVLENTEMLQQVKILIEGEEEFVQTKI